MEKRVEKDRFLLEKCILGFCVVRCLMITGVFSPILMSNSWMLQIIPCQIYTMASFYGTVMAFRGLANVSNRLVWRKLFSNFYSLILFSFLPRAFCSFLSTVLYASYSIHLIHRFCCLIRFFLTQRKLVAWK
jgi:hypothetical protein